MDIKTGFYRHFKGNLYEVLGTATHSETREPMVVYRALYGEYGLWVRPAAMWNETVDRGRLSWAKISVYRGQASGKRVTRSPSRRADSGSLWRALVKAAELFGVIAGVVEAAFCRNFRNACRWHGMRIAALCSSRMLQ